MGTGPGVPGLKARFAEGADSGEQTIVRAMQNASSHEHKRPNYHLPQGSTAEQKTDSQEHQVLVFCRVRGLAIAPDIPRCRVRSGYDSAGA